VNQPPPAHHEGWVDLGNVAIFIFLKVFSHIMFLVKENRFLKKRNILVFKMIIIIFFNMKKFQNKIIYFSTKMLNLPCYYGTGNLSN
jgi:hypothetical protein